MPEFVPAAHRESAGDIGNNGEGCEEGASKFGNMRHEAEKGDQSAENKATAEAEKLLERVGLGGVMHRSL